MHGAIVGAGTVLNARDAERAAAAGARFLVSPGLTEPLARRRGRSCRLPFLGGVATAGDIMRGLDLGLDRFKFFPAENSAAYGHAEGLRRPLPAGALLPHRRDHRGHRAVLPGPAECRLHRRDLRHAQGGDRRRGLGRASPSWPGAPRRCPPGRLPGDGPPRIRAASTSLASASPSRCVIGLHRSAPDRAGRRPLCDASMTLREHGVVGPDDG